MPQDPFEHALAAAWPPASWANHAVLLAVSGGADSVALLRGMLAIRQPGAGCIVAAHFNHGLRGEASRADAQFVQTLCERHAVRLEMGAAGVDSSPEPNAAEDASRRQRYAFLTSAARRCGARQAATAHTADDQAETILHRIVRGAGLAGLAGMPAVRLLCADIPLLRPLLNVRREEVLAYLQRLDQPYCQDQTNFDRRYTRNRIRHELLPLLTEYNPAIRDALLRLGAQAAEAHEELTRQARDLAAAALLHRDHQGLKLDCHPLSRAPRCIMREALVLLWKEQGWPEQAMGYEHWNQLADLALRPLSAPSPARRTLPGGVDAMRQGDQLVLTLRNPLATSNP